ncbi:MAG: GyrI-like domain-containing protein, partial [Candidatus Margulisbacteria bacterium]|nr:GyrI-like domain-containing protein [Candidatus Margulisiibacteriota bacterium]
MRLLKRLLILLIVLAVLFAGFLAYMGYFGTPQVTEQEMGPYTIAYESFVGPYAESGKVFDRLFKSLKTDGVEATRGFGIYYDDPAITPKDQLRSDCGIIIEEQNLKKLAQLKKKYLFMTIPRQKYLVVEFPIKNMLSYMIGPMKAYPAMS